MSDPDAYVLLRLHDVRHGVPAEVEAVRFLQTEAEAERAAQRMNADNVDSTVQYSWTVAVAQGNGEYAFGTQVRDTAGDDRPWAPAHNQDQLCEFCGVSRPVFVHRLDPAHVEFRIYGKGYTLPAFWAACVRCNALISDGDDARLLELMTHVEADDLFRQAMLAAFRASDLGSEPLAEGPPNPVRP